MEDDDNEIRPGPECDGCLHWDEEVWECSNCDYTIVMKGKVRGNFSVVIDDIGKVYGKLSYLLTHNITKGKNKNE